MSRSLVSVVRKLSKVVDTLTFGDPVTHVYNPLNYAWEPHRRYLEQYGQGPKEVVLIGMNPGPYGMAQTGVPFGEVALVRDWLGVNGRVKTPDREHPKRPITGFDCTRSEVSGRRLWGWAQERFGTPEAFFSRFFVHNFCPLVFMEETGRNRTPDKLPAEERAPLFDACDQALAEMVACLQPKYVLGVGAFAEARARAVLGEPEGVTIGRILHPSPASPVANRGWAEQAEKDFATLGIDLGA